MTPTATAPPSLIGKCLRHIRGKHLTEYLKSYAEDVVIAARIMGPRAAGESLGKEIFGKDKGVSPTPILTIVAMVESGEIPMTRERLKAVVDQDKGAMLFYARNPWIIDPTGKSAPPVKKGRKPRIEKAPAPPTRKKQKQAKDPDSEATEAAPEDFQEQENESNGKKTKIRASVTPPPKYSPEDFLPKAPPALNIPISGLKTNKAD